MTERREFSVFVRPVTHWPVRTLFFAALRVAVQRNGIAWRVVQKSAGMTAY